MNLSHHPADHEAMCGQHNEFTDAVGDAVIRIQDEAYALGLKRGRQEGAAPDLLRALQAMVRIYCDGIVDERDRDESFPNQWHDEQCKEAELIARSAMAKATGGQS